MKYKISNEAKRDIENLWLYTLNEWSIQAADRYVRLIMDEILYVADHPHSATDCSEIREGYYKTRVKSHFIFYRLNNETIEVVRVLHQQMDIPRQL